jgi:hypothetical protein
MKKGIQYLISLIAACAFSLCPAFSQEAWEAALDVDKVYYDFYAGNIENLQDAAAAVLAGAGEDNLLHYINSWKVLSALYSTGYLPEYENEIAAFDASIVEKLKKAKLTSAVCLAYADYLYSKLSWEIKNTKTVMALPVWYRRALLLEPNNTEANVKLALWYISAADENSRLWNAFIQRQEQNIELLGEADRFNAYLLYSMFYMKTYNVNKGFLYLNRAKELFPDNPLPALIAYNYEEGKLSW